MGASGAATRNDHGPISETVIYSSSRISPRVKIPRPERLKASDCGRRRPGHGGSNSGCSATPAFDLVETRWWRVIPMYTQRHNQFCCTSTFLRPASHPLLTGSPANLDRSASYRLLCATDTLGWTFSSACTKSPSDTSTSCCS